MQQYGLKRFLYSLVLIYIQNMYIVHKSNQSCNNCTKGQIGTYYNF